MSFSFAKSSFEFRHIILAHMRKEFGEHGIKGKAVSKIVQYLKTHQECLECFVLFDKHHLLYPRKQSFSGGIKESPCPSVFHLGKVKDTGRKCAKFMSGPLFYMEDHWTFLLESVS